MKVSAVAASLAVVLSAAPVFAQALGQPPKPQTPPATPAQPPAQPAVQTPPPPAAPFPAGAKIAFFRPQVVFQSSAEGKAALTRVQALTQKKQNENAAKNKALQDAQAKLQGQGGVLNDAARAQLEKDIDKLQRDIQFSQSNAQAEMQDLNNELQAEFTKKVGPIIEEIAKEKGLYLVFTTESGFAYVHPGLNISEEVIKRLDSKKN